MGGNFALGDPCKGEAGDLIGSCDPALSRTSSSLTLADMGTKRFDDVGVQLTMDAFVINRKTSHFCHTSYNIHFQGKLQIYQCQSSNH